MSKKNKPTPPKSAPITIDTGSREYNAYITIHDDGHGLVFEVFEQGDNSVVDKPLHADRTVFATQEEAELAARRWCEAHSAHEAKLELARREAAVEAIAEISKNEAQIAKLEAQRRDLGNAIKGLREQNREALARATDPQLPFDFSATAPAIPASSGEWELKPDDDFDENFPAYSLERDEVECHAWRAVKGTWHVRIDVRDEENVEKHVEALTEDALRSMLDSVVRQAKATPVWVVFNGLGQILVQWDDEGLKSFSEGETGKPPVELEERCEFAGLASLAPSRLKASVAACLRWDKTCDELMAASISKKKASKKTAKKATKPGSPEKPKKPKKQAGLDPSQVQWPSEEATP